jgi:hypothetical protein
MARIKIGASGTVSTVKRLNATVRLGYTYDPTNTFRDYNDSTFARHFTRFIGEAVRGMADYLFNSIRKEHKMHHGKVDRFNQLAYNIAYLSFFTLYGMEKEGAPVNDETVKHIVYKSLLKGNFRWESLFAVDKPNDNIHTLTDEVIRLYKGVLTTTRVQYMYEQIRKSPAFAIAASINTTSKQDVNYDIHGCDKDGKLIWYGFDELSEDVARQTKVGLSGYLLLLYRVFWIWYNVFDYEQMVQIAKSGTYTELVDFINSCYKETDAEVVDYMHTNKDLMDVTYNAIRQIGNWRRNDIAGIEKLNRNDETYTLFGVDGECVAKTLKSEMQGEQDKNSYDFHMLNIFSQLLGTGERYTLTINTSEGDIEVENPVLATRSYGGVSVITYINDQLPISYSNEFPEEYKSNAYIIVSRKHTYA